MVPGRQKGIIEAMDDEGGHGAAAMATDLAAATSVYTEHRQTLFAVVYDLLGTVADTEDVLQQTWVSWSAVRREDVISPRRYLLRIAVNEALNQLRSARQSRETYIGPWLPEPVITDDDPAVSGALRSEAVSFGMLVVLETLSPLERAVFVLREAFDFDHAEIAEVLDRTPAAVRQIARRAREHVKAKPSRFKPDPDLHRAVTERFVSAAVGGDLTALMELLAPDVALWTDSGGKLRTARNVIVGADKIARLAQGRYSLLPPGIEFRHLDLNGAPAALGFTGDRLYGALITELDAADRISGIYVVVNPEKLASVAERVRLRDR
jgi:RNA polymerase sigma factor (sigma-70 family)